MPQTTPSPLATRSYRAFLWAQALSAFNDNAYRFVMSAAAVGAAGAAAAGELSWMGLVFSAPFLLLSGYAGQVADAVNKRTVIVAAKAAEVAVMVLAAVALQRGAPGPLLAVLALLGVQATFFSPAKYGIVPELLGDVQLSRGNGALQMTTFLAILLGGAMGPLLYGAWHGAPWRIGAVLVMVAVLGLVASLAIGPVAAPAATSGVSFNPAAGLGQGARRLLGDRTLLQTGVGIAWFWGLGALLQLAIVLVGRSTLGLGDSKVAALAACLAVGIGLGSVVAGRVSGDKVELGLAPIGGFGMGACTLAFAASSSFTCASLALVLLGLSGGFFIVPLNALLQQRPARQERGQVLATVNLLATGGVLAASGVLWLLAERMAWAPGRILLAAGLATLAGSVYVLWLVPEFLMRLVLWTLTHTVYRIRIDGLRHVPVRGPALLVCNHLSHVDGLIVGASMQRFVRFIVYRPIYELPLLRPLFDLMHVIPVSAQRQDIVRSLARARRELETGHVVCIFAEGAISRTGNLLPFKRGFERIVAGLDVPVIPVNLDRLWGSIFSFKQGKFFWKWPERVPFPVTVTFGAPMPSSSSAGDVRHAVMLLASDAMIHRVARHEVLHQRFFRTAKRHWGQLAMADADAHADLRPCARRRAAALAVDQRSTAAGAGWWASCYPPRLAAPSPTSRTLIAGRVPVNLNFTAGQRVDRVGHRAVRDRHDPHRAGSSSPRRSSTSSPGMVLLEDVMPHVRVGVEARDARRRPPRAGAGCSIALYAPEPDDADELATVIFSSGSTGAPKGVMLSHRNVLSNLEAMAQLLLDHLEATASSASCRSSTRSASPGRCGSRWSAASRRSTCRTRWTPSRSARWRGRTARPC